MIAGKGCIVLAAALLSGCAGSIPVRLERPTEKVLEPAAATTTQKQDIFRGIPDKYRGLADSAEKAGDLRRTRTPGSTSNGWRGRSAARSIANTGPPWRWRRAGKRRRPCGSSWQSSFLTPITRRHYGG